MTGWREWARPAARAAVWPKLRRRRTSLTARSEATSRFITSHVPSVLPSSTKTIS